METKIHLWSGDGTVEIGKDLKFKGFTTQVETYFNRFGHLPKRGNIVFQDTESKNDSSVIYVDDIEYSGIQDGYLSIGISLTTEQPR